MYVLPGRAEEGIRFPDLKLQAAVNGLLWALRNELQSCRRVISTDPVQFFAICLFCVCV